MDQSTEASINACVRAALAEDIGDGDITAQLIPENTYAEAKLLCRDQAVIAGQPWFEAVFAAIDPTILIKWQIKEGGYDFSTRKYFIPGSKTVIDSDTTVIIFHGNPNPHECDDKEIAQYWI